MPRDKNWNRRAMLGKLSGKVKKREMPGNAPRENNGNRREMRGTMTGNKDNNNGHEREMHGKLMGNRTGIRENGHQRKIQGQVVGTIPREKTGIYGKCAGH